MNTLTKEKTNSVELAISDLSEIKKLTGESSAVSLPYAPIIKVNNKKADSGLKTKFITVNKDGQNYETVDFADEFTAQVLLVRYFVSEPYKKDQKPTWYSREFDDFTFDTITVFDSDSDNEKWKGSYFDFKKKYSSYDGDGNKVKSLYNFTVSVYLLVQGGLYRLHLSGSSRTAWFDFTKTFSRNETWLQIPVTFSTRVCTEEEQGSLDNPWNIVEMKKEEPVSVEELNENVKKVTELKGILRQLSNTPLNEIKVSPSTTYTEEVNKQLEGAQIQDNVGVIPF